MPLIFYLKLLHFIGWYHLFLEIEYEVLTYTLNNFQWLLCNLIPESLLLLTFRNITKEENDLSDWFWINWITPLIIIFLFALIWLWKSKIAKTSKLSFYLRTQVFSKYMFFTSTYIYFWIWYEIFSFNELYSYEIVSYLFTLICTIFISLFTYWFVINPFSKWKLWSMFQKINEIKLEFLLLENIKPNEYILITKYNLVRKLIFSILITLMMRFNQSSLIFTFLAISTQLMYSNIIIGLCQFDSSTTRGLVIFNELATSATIILTSAEYLNNSFGSNQDNYHMNDLWLLLIRIQILLIIIIEILRWILFIISKLVSALIEKCF